MTSLITIVALTVMINIMGGEKGYYSWLIITSSWSIAYSKAYKIIKLTKKASATVKYVWGNEQQQIRDGIRIEPEPEPNEPN